MLSVAADATAGPSGLGDSPARVGQSPSGWPAELANREAYVMSPSRSRGFARVVELCYRGLSLMYCALTKPGGAFSHG